jgi:hypothetical protein
LKGLPSYERVNFIGHAPWFIQDILVQPEFLMGVHFPNKLFDGRTGAGDEAQIWTGERRSNVSKTIFEAEVNERGSIVRMHVFIEEIVTTCAD